MQVPALINLAKGAVGSMTALANELGVPDTVLHEYSKGRRSCPLDVQAMLADIAGFNATAQVHEAMLSKHQGTPRGERLAKALKKPLKQDEPRLRREMGNAQLGVLATICGLAASAAAAGAGHPWASTVIGLLTTRFGKSNAGAHAHSLRLSAT